MKVTGLRPMLWTEDLDGTIGFYVDVLGFTCVEKSDDWGWTSLRLDQVWIMLAKPNEHTPYEKIGFTGTFYYTVDDVEEMWSKVHDKASVCYGIEDFEWGMREFAIFDNNGYMLQFGQEIEVN